MTLNNPSPDEEEEFFLLMSLALDGLLDQHGRARLDAQQSKYPVLATEWRSWQLLDSQLRATPQAVPPSLFVETFSLRLAQQERRRRLWWGVGFGAVVLLLSLGVAVGLVSLGVFVMLRQPGWLTELVHMLALSYVSLMQGVETVQAALWSVLGSEQMRIWGTVYVCAAAALLAGWVVFLRRTTRAAEMSLFQ